MDILSPLILLHGNGYKAFTSTESDDNVRLVVTELKAKMACVAEGDLDVTNNTTPAVATEAPLFGTWRSQHSKAISVAIKK